MPNSNEPIEDIYSLIDEINNDHSIKLFTYALGDDGSDTIVNITLLKEMACRYKGIMFNIRNTNSLADTMGSYYTYIAAGVEIDNPVWTEPYDDAFGFGRMVTVSYPIYYTNEQSEIRYIVGVASIDVTMDSLTRFGMSEDEIVDKLLAEYPCNNNSLTDCQLENLRPEESECGESNCDEVTDVQQC